MRFRWIVEVLPDGRNSGMRIHFREINGLIDATVGISGAGNGAGRIDADFFGQLANRHHIDELQKLDDCWILSNRVQATDGSTVNFC